MNKKMFYMFLFLFSFSSFPAGKIEVKGGFLMSPSKKSFTFLLTKIEQKSYVALKEESSGRKCNFLITKKTAPQQLKGMKGVVHANSTKKCSLDYNNDKIILLDIYYTIDINQTITGEIQISTASQSSIFSLN